MSEAERMMLADAIDIAIQAEKKAMRWRRISMILSIVIILLAIVLIGG